MIRITLLLAAGFSAATLNAQPPGEAAAPLVSSVEPPRVRDPRIRILDYDPDRIFTITGHTGYQMTVEFEPGETVETVGIGDSSGWQVTPNGNASLLFLKPMALAPATNMMLVTNKRRYNIELLSRSGARAGRDAVTYVLRFRLPPPPPAPADAAPGPDDISQVPRDLWNRNYRFEGSRELVPQEIFDDGRYTYIRFPETLETPAIFAVSGAEDENLVNSNLRGDHVMIDRVAEQIVLRHGKLVTRLFNEAYVMPDPGPDAPKPRARKKRSFLGLGR